MSEPPVGLIGSLPTGVAIVDADDSGMKRAGGGGGGGEEGRGVAFVSCAGTVGVCFVAGGASCGGSGESGTMAFFSWIEFTTFSRSMGAMCLPRTWLLVESWRRRSGRDDELERVVAVRAQSTAESSEAMLEESSGTSSTTALLASKDQGEGAEWTGWQQKVSRDQTLQAWVIVSGGSGSKRAGDSPCFHSACRPPWRASTV